MIKVWWCLLLKQKTDALLPETNLQKHLEITQVLQIFLKKFCVLNFCSKESYFIFTDWMKTTSKGFLVSHKAKEHLGNNCFQMLNFCLIDNKNWFGFNFANIFTFVCQLKRAIKLKRTKEEQIFGVSGVHIKIKFNSKMFVESECYLLFFFTF
jgi:hypothetical protein